LRLCLSDCRDAGTELPLVVSYCGNTHLENGSHLLCREVLAVFAEKGFSFVRFHGGCSSFQRAIPFSECLMRSELRTKTSVHRVPSVLMRLSKNNLDRFNASDCNRFPE